jgi:hypothetical protein
VSDPLIFLCRAGDLTQPSKVALRKAGVIVVESKSPGQCSLLKINTTLSGDQITAASLKALASHRAWQDDGKINSIGKAQSTFVQAMNEIMNPPAKAEGK